MTSPDDRVLFDVDSEKRIATITLNNPDQRNSYDATMRDAVARHLDRVAEDDDITVVLLRGADGVFSTGADMNNAYGWYGDERSREEQKTTDRGEKPAKSRPSQRRRLTVDRKSFSFYHNLMGFPKVTVGEISGYALGGGFEMALMTDIAVIGRDTKIGMPATRFLGPALGSLHMFFHRLGPVLARRLLLTATSSRPAPSSTSASSPTRAIRPRSRPGRDTGRRRPRRCPPTASSSPRKRSASSSRARPTRVRKWPATCSTPTGRTCSSRRGSSTSSRRGRSTEPKGRSGCVTSTSTCQSRSDAGHLLAAIQYLLLL
jgi:enoyl-CoA hydratase/carnithine racemase